MRPLIFFFSLMFLLSCASTGPKQEAKHEHDKFTKHLENSTLKVTKKGLFSVEMVIKDDKFLVGLNSVDIIIHDNRDRDVTGAEITFAPWMPEMGHGVFEDPVITEKGSGVYTVENIIIVMGGHWEVRINIKKGDKEDSVVFDYPIIRTSLEYDYIRGDTPAGYNAVLGMENPLEEAEYETIIEDGLTIKVFNLTVKDVGFELFPDAPTMGWGFDGQIPGPTVRVTMGDRIRLILQNESSGSHTIHVHGQSKPLTMDGVPYIGQKPVKKGETYTYEFTAKNLGTSFYHCHVDSAHHVDMGMYGAFIVEPKEEKLMYDREYIMILDEWPTEHKHVTESDDEIKKLDKEGFVTINKESSDGHEHGGPVTRKRDYYPKIHNPHNPEYDAFTINGKSFPLTEPLDVKEGEKVRIRFINAGYQQHFMHTHSHKFQVVARDGSYVDEPQKIDTVGIGPAQRVDIILYADNPGIWPFHCHRLNHVANDHIYPGGMLTFIRYIE